MILLHRLFAHNFKQLTDVTLHLPTAGAVLIEGNNEAGKSSLFEAVFFALYGRPLLSDRDYKITDLRRYGTDALEVQLDFSIGDKQLFITRRVGKNHTAKLTIANNDTHETINSLSEVQRRLKEEIRLSDDALLNTCYVEQKRLERLEDLDASTRRATINDLLNLRVLTDLESKFKITREDREQLQTIKAHLAIAHLDTAIPEIEAEVQKARRALAYAVALEADEKRRLLQHDIDNFQTSQNLLASRRAEIAGSLQQRASLQARLTSLQSDIALRLRAWREALASQQQTEQRLHDMQNVVFELPQRQAQLQQWQTLAARLESLEALKARAVTQQAEIITRREQLQHHVGVLQEWQQGEVQRNEIAIQLERAQEELRAGQQTLQLRQQANERHARLSLFLQHITTHSRLAAEVQQFSAREQAARDEAASLPMLEAQLQELHELEVQSQQREEAQRLLERSEVELASLQREREADENLTVRHSTLAAQRRELQQQADIAETEKQAHARTLTRAWSTLVLGVVVLVTGFVTGHAGVPGIAGIALIVYGLVSALMTKQTLAKISANHSGVLQELNALHGEQRGLTIPLPASGKESLSARIEELQGAIDEPGKSLQKGIPFPSREALQEQRRVILAAQARGQAAQQMLNALEQQLANTQHQIQAELSQLQTLADELKLPGQILANWTGAADAEYQALLQERSTLPDNALLETVEQKRQVVAGFQHRQAVLTSEQMRRRVELETTPHPALEAELAAAESALRAITDDQESYADVRTTLQSLELPVQYNELQTHLALVEQRLDQLSDLVQQVPLAQQEMAARSHETKTRYDELLQAWNDVMPEIPLPSEPREAETQLVALRSATEQAVSAISPSSLAAEDKALAEEQAELERNLTTWKHQQQESLRLVRAQKEQLGFSHDDPLVTIAVRLPEVSGVTAHDVEKQTGVLRAQEDALRDSRNRRHFAAEALSLGEEPLDVASVEAELAAAEQSLSVKRRAGEIVVRTRQGIVGRVMPLTMQNMRRLLPLLTDGRYQDAQWDEENNVIAIYDNLARSFQRKRVFSGGARDQISLALRLAFALATLPGEHNIRPGWLFLDEPLSSFDRPRTLALVELLTQGLIRRHFAQIFLVSHSESFDPAQFDYRLRMEAGRVVESTLPPG